MIRTFFAAFAVFVLTGSPAIRLGAQTPITERNWVNHPDIVAVRAVFMEIETALKMGGLQEEDFNLEGGYDQRYYLDSSGRIRKVTMIRFEDTRMECEYYYDSSARLRFVYVTAPFGEHRNEYRVYFGTDGREIWRNARTFDDFSFPEFDGDYIVRNAAEALETARRNSGMSEQ